MWFQSRLVQNDSTVVLFKTAASQLISLVIYSSIAGSSSWQWCSTGGNLGKIAESVGHSIQTFRVFVALIPSASGFFQHATWPCLPLELPFGFLRFRRCPHTRRYGCNRSIELRNCIFAALVFATRCCSQDFQRVPESTNSWTLDDVRRSLITAQSWSGPVFTLASEFPHVGTLCKGKHIWAEGAASAPVRTTNTMQLGFR